MARIIKDVTRSAIRNDSTFVLTRKHLHNISASYKIDKEGFYHKDDNTSSIAALIDLKSTFTGTFCLKYRIHFNDYCVDEAGLHEPQPFREVSHGVAKTYPMAQSFLVLMTPYQVIKLREHGNNIIGVDSTHLVTAYGHYLTTIMVRDERKQGLAVAFCLSQKKDKATYTEFFRTVRDAIRHPINCKYFISDGDLTLYDSWKAVMGEAEQARLCMWHVLLSWGRRIHKLRFSEEAAEEINSDLRALIEQPSREM